MAKAKPKPRTAMEVFTPPPPDLATAIADVDAAMSTIIAKEFSMVEATDEVTQARLVAFRDLERLEDFVVKRMKVCKELLLSQAQAKAIVAPGPLTLHYAEGKRANPGWKDEAIKQAGLCAKAEGRHFDDEVYAANFAKAAPSSIVKKLEVIERT